MHPTKIFETPFWLIEGDLPKGMYDWSREYEKNTPSRKASNRGGYQSIDKTGLDDIPFEYTDILRERLLFLPRFYFSNWWLNVNYKGDYNVVHTHPMTHLAVIWYMTDNHGLLHIRDPLGHMRWELYDRLGIEPYKVVNATAGDIVIFPSDIEHSVEPHDMDTARICLSTNLILDNPN